MIKIDILENGFVITLGIRKFIAKDKDEVLNILDSNWIDK